MATAKDVMTVAIGEIGYMEYPANSNRTKYGKEYGADGVAWCCIWDWWIFKHAKASELFYDGKKTAYVPTLDTWGVSKKQTVSKASGQYGDIVIFDFNHNKSGDHTGVIEKKNSDGSYTTIEGNTSMTSQDNGGKVMKRVRYQSDILRIIRPKYSGKSTSPSTSTTTSKINVDGLWGKDTTKKSQKMLGTVQDGIVSGQETDCKKYLEACLVNSWSFSKTGKGSSMVKAIQKLVGATQDGICGPKTVKALQKFLTNKGYSLGDIDGYMGVKTVTAWQKYVNSKL